MDILIIAHFTNLPSENGNDRFSYLANLMANRASEDEVEVVTSSFSHMKKCQRVANGTDAESTNHKITMCYEPGYSKNVCLKRFYSHYIFAKNLRKYLDSRKVPDVIYCAVPSLDAAYIAMKYAKENQIRFIIDVQDLWPEAFEMVFHVPVLSDIIFKPMRNIANKIYSYADEIIAVSDTYCKRAKSVNNKVSGTKTCFLGTDLQQFDNFSSKYLVKKTKDAVWLAYCGTLGHSYDLKCVMDAMEILVMQGIDNIKFIVMGDGPLKNEFENYAKNKNIAVEFTGRLEYEKMCGMLVSCDIAMNVISHGAAQSIINKHADYAAAGIPVISTQENQEYINLVDEYHMGFNCSNGNAVELAEKISILASNEKLREELGKNARKCAQERFNRKKTYEEIVSIVKDQMCIGD